MDRSRLTNRRSIRLRDFDYTQNASYFVTICTVQRLCLFGEIVNGEVRLSPIGEIVNSRWRDLPAHTPGLYLDVWVVMPNHLHGIVVLPGSDRARIPDDSPRGPHPGSLGAAIGGFKSAVSREVAMNNLSVVRPLWQRNYFERVIRNDRELAAIQRYILENPLRWDYDPEHPSRR
jgi:putative transposase